MAVFATPPAHAMSQAPHAALMASNPNEFIALFS
jgi:hypothetical protein